MDDKKVALLPCPFCGGVKFHQNTKAKGYFVKMEAKRAGKDQSNHLVRCTKCGAKGPLKQSADDAATAWNTRQPQTDARVADLLFKLDVAATTFEKVTTSEHREAVFNAEHAKLLRDTIKVLRQAQTDALKIARERITEWCDAVAVEWGQGSQTHNVARDGRDIVLAALRQPQTDAIERALCEANGCVWDLDPDSDSRQQWSRDVAIVLAALKESK